MADGDPSSMLAPRQLAAVDNKVVANFIPEIKMCLYVVILYSGPGALFDLLTSAFRMEP